MAALAKPFDFHQLQPALFASGLKHVRPASKIAGQQ